MTTESAPPQAPETHQFQAEIRQLLDIVIHSLYTNREIFVRELVSNAADALERFRHESLLDTAIPGRDSALEIRIETDHAANRFVISDTGVGMTREELLANLGTIARSGTKEFLARLTQGASRDINLIGQFGVGFYSAFMVAKRVIVETRSFAADAQGWEWTSEAAGTYTLQPKEGLSRGTRITLELKDEASDFAREGTVSDTIRRFSNFVPFPILVGGERVNTVQAIWARNKAEVKEEEYVEFFKFIAGEDDSPRYWLHFTADAPLAISALLFVPPDSLERLGFGRMKPGVDLHCRKVLLQKHPDDLLPEWMRFVRGVVDSEDLPLNISRESMQDSALVRKLSRVIAGKFIKFLDEQAKADPEKYDAFFKVFGHFLKEGAAQDYAHKAELSKLLRFESSATEPGKTTSLADYVARMKPEQKDIYFVNAPSRASAEGSPYAEAFKARSIEVLYTFEAFDDFVLNNMMAFDGKNIVSGDRADIELPDLEDAPKDELSKSECDDLCSWMKKQLGGRVGAVRTSKRLTASPAVAVMEGGASAAMQRVLMSLRKDEESPGPKATLELNPAHPLVRRIFALHTGNEDFATTLAEQLHDNALLAAGLLQDPRAMVERLNALLARAAEATPPA